MITTKSFALDLQSNIKKIPLQVSYIFTKLRKRLKKIFITDKNITNETQKKEIKDKIIKTLIKYFFKNIIAEKLKKFCNERKEYFYLYFSIPTQSSDDYFEFFK